MPASKPKKILTPRKIGKGKKKLMPGKISERRSSKPKAISASTRGTEGPRKSMPKTPQSYAMNRSSKLSNRKPAVAGRPFKQESVRENKPNETVRSQIATDKNGNRRWVRDVPVKVYRSKQSSQASAYNKVLRKAKGDATKIRGFKYGRGTK